MATNVTRITNTGNLLVNGTFDEFTGAPVINSNVVLWLDAAQTSSYSGTGNTWTDLSTANNTGTLVSSPTFDSISGGGSLTFNGTSFVSLAANLVPTGSRSITMAFQSSNVSTRVGLISNRDSGGWFCCLNRGGNSNINYDHATSGGIEGLSASNVITALNTWYIAALIYDVSTGNASIYLNGSLVAGPTTISPIVPVLSNNSYIGKEVNSGSTLLGKVGDVLVYNRALTAGEVLQNYNALAGRYGLTANTSGTAIQRTTSNTVLAEQFDEVTYNTASPTIKNLLINSQNFEQTSVTGWWGANPGNAAAYITTAATTSPAGDNTGEKLYSAPAVVGSAIQRLYRPIQFTAGQTYTFSVYAKAAEFSQFWSFVEPASGRIGIVVNLTTLSVTTYLGTPTNLFLTSVGNGWYRTGFTWTAPATESIPVNVMRLINNSGLSTFVGDGVSGVYVWGAQLELGSTATIYQPIAAANTLVTTGMAQRVDSGGNMYVSNIFDEVTGTASVVDGLVAYYDPAYTSSYSGSGANLYNLVDGVAATLNGTYSASTAALGTSVSGAQTIRLTNSDLVTATNNISHIQAPSFTNITTVSIWYYQHSYNGIARYIFDGRTGGTGGWIYNGSIGSNWTTGIAYVNGGASSGTPSWANWGGDATGVWKNVTFVASTPFTDDVNIFSRFTDNEGLDVTFGPILIYNRALTQAENAQNFNYFRTRFGI